MNVSRPRPCPWPGVVATVGLLLVAMIVVPGAQANESSAATASGEASAAGAGESIYLRGLAPSGEAVRAQREPGMQVAGANAACVNCHRRSGLGMKEGRRTIPPVAGRYLFHPRAVNADELDLPYVDGMKPDRDPYTDATLARAIRSGIGADGKPLSYLMPHFDLDEAQMASMIQYLRRLSPGPVPGVTDSVLHFATIVTPDADPVAREGMLAVLTKFFEDKNHFTRAESPRLRSSRRMMFKVNRHWQLHVWELTGPPRTWESQLRAKLAAEPVFAVVSGIGRRTWAPVHRFCEQQALPCLFPNLDLPVDRQGDFDTLYLSGGVLLEAALIAHAVAEQAESSSTRRVVQFFRNDDVGVDAARVLRSALEAQHTPVEDIVVIHDRDLTAALSHLQAADTAVLWLRQPDLARLGMRPPAVSRVFLSGRMAGLEHAVLPPDWRAVAKMAYPFDLPEKRRVQVDFPLGWFRMRQIPVVAEQVQTDTYLVCAILAEVVNHMVDTFVRDYLVERVEESLEHRIITGYYPRLALAPQQRFASKGGYFVRFADSQGERVVADGGWVVP